MRHGSRLFPSVVGLCALVLVSTSCSGDGGLSDLTSTSAAASPATTTTTVASPAATATTAAPATTSATTLAPETTTTTEAPSEGGTIEAFVPVLTRSGEVDISDPPLDPSVVERSRDVTLSTGFVETLGLTRGTSTVAFDLFDDTRIVAAGEYADTTDSGFSWKGTPVEGGGNVMVVVRNGAMTAHMSVPGGSYEIRPLEDGRHSIVEFDSDAEIPDGHIEAPEGSAGSIPDRAPATSASQKQETVIDVLILWTAAAQAKVGGAENMRAEVDLMMLQTNTAFENSGINITARLAGAKRVGYTESRADTDDTLFAGLDDLYQLTCTGPGEPWTDCPEDSLLDGVHRLRRDTGADLVSLIVDHDDFGGLAWVPVSPDASLGFSVVDVDTATWTMAHTHEISHNMGAGHDRAASQPGPAGYSDYAAGHVEDGTYRTVMAYWTSCTQDCPRVPYYSTPDVTFDFGGAVQTPGSETENNARVLNEFAAGVAAYREIVEIEDRDGDGVPDSTDLCPDDPDPAQIDTDADGSGDECDDDDDGDELLDDDDLFPLTYSVCSGKGATILGTPGDDELVGTDGQDVIMGLGGDDRIEGLGGNDRICGGPGNDELLGGPGSDVIVGAGGDDFIDGGAGPDRLLGGAAADEILGARGDDHLSGGGDDDILRGGGENDVLEGGPGNDRLFGDAGDDTMRGDQGRDELRGGGGDDASYGGPGEDKCSNDPVRVACELAL